MRNVLFIAIAATASIAPTAQAATLTVTNLADSGTGSLRAAIASANATTGADTIQFQPGLTGTITLTTGELHVTDSLTLVGPGASRITVDANGASRVFHLDSANPENKSYTLSGLTVTGGSTGAGAGNDSGGGLFFELAASSSARPPIALSNMAFAGNHAARNGGGVSVSGANLSVTNVAITGNQVTGGFQPAGGGLFFNRGQVRIERSRIVGNNADLSAGGIYLSSPGVSAVMVDTLVQDNTATLSGGGMVGSTMSSLSISRSAFIDNAVTSQTEGGGLYFVGVTDAGSAENVIENSTFSGNISQHQSGRGSALAIAGGNMTVRNSTFAFNKTSPDTAPGTNAGGALWVANGGSTKVTVQSTLFTGNTHGNASLPSDLTRLTGGTVQSTLNVDHSLFEVMPAIGVITAPGAGNLEADALLMPLTDTYGGLTPVHPIPFESPAVDAGSNPANLATDQRGAGYPRAVDANACHRPLVARPDIGAFEYRADTIFCYGFEN